MNARIRARERRKADLIAASTLLRPHAAGAVRELAGFADGVTLRVIQLRTWLADPLVQRTGAALVTLVATRRWLRRRRASVQRPARTAGLMTWVTLTWRIGRWASPWITAWLMRGGRTG
ncbi:MAG: hypothetical protein AB7U92_18060 [Piscinibacter sp.]|uniref:hypothetical protein n=1 Tax=Piscinibacter sp. TaxID=1903157 RepID=UPI003D0A5117